MKWLLFLLLTVVAICSHAQGVVNQRQEATSMVIEGRVVNERNQPLIGVNIEGPMGRYTTTDTRGRFELPANLGDEITIRGLGFKTVYHRVRSQDDLEIRVMPATSSLEAVTMDYTTALDSATYYEKLNSTKAANFIIDALTSTISLSNVQKSNAYLRLGNLYLGEQQYDLAVEALTESVALRSQIENRLQLAHALLLNGNYQESIDLYLSLESQGLTGENLSTALQGLATNYSRTGKPAEAIESLERLLELSKKTNSRIASTEILTQIAEIYAANGSVDKASGFYNTALESVANNTDVNSIATRSKTADFYNSNQDFEAEIKLRKSNIEAIEQKKKNAPRLDSTSTAAMSFAQNENITSDEEEIIIREIVEESDIKTDDNEINTSNNGGPITDNYSKQKEQLKIANAFKSQNKIDESIKYALLSYNEASNTDDLIVQKDAALQLIELYRKKKNLTKTLEYSDKYIAALDRLYTTKESELLAAERRSKELVAQQSRIQNLETSRRLTENKLQLAATQLELEDEVNQRQRWIIYSLAAVALLLLVLAYFMYRNGKQQKINNQLLALKSLRSQMNPHFIFNALNSVNSYIALNDERAANKYLSDFSKLMRSVLENSELDLISLDKEIELLSLYLKLEHERFSDKFDFKVIVDPALEDTIFKVPPMLLQPIIENAVWHGLRYKQVKGFLKLEFNLVKPKQLEILITDNGIGRKRSRAIKTVHQKSRESKGLGNVQNRVDLLNSLDYVNIELEVRDAHLQPDTGTAVRILIKENKSL
ncbi:MAG: histidine kinase [Nonlabens sp.]